MTRRSPSILFAAVLTSLALPASAQPANTVVGEKLDSGLGSLPHYAQWGTPSAVKAVVGQVDGESLDNQLGELPHYRLWVDRSGKDPMGTLAAAAIRMAGALPAAKPAARAAVRPSVKPSEGIVQASN